MNEEERRSLLERMRARFNRGRTGKEPDSSEDEPDETRRYKIEAAKALGKDQMPTWSEFQREAVVPIEELRKVDPAGLGNVIIADDRSKADKTPEQALRESESIEDRWAREKNEKMAANLNRYESGPAAKLVHGEVDGERWKRVRGAINEARATEHYGAEWYHDLLHERNGVSDEGGPLRSDWKEYREDQIRQGIKEGFLRVDERLGIVVPVHKDPARPGEKLITRRIRKGERQDDSGLEV